MTTAAVHISGDLPAVLSLEKQLDFAAARALTETAESGADASRKAVRSTFTTRGRWYEPGNRFGVRARPARKGDLTSAVETAADWLELHETGGVKTPRGGHLAVPTANVRRSKRQTIPKSQRPGNLRGAFVRQTRSGPVLFQRKSGGGLVALYGLESRARIRRQSTVVEPVTKVVERRFGSIFDKALSHALETAK